MESSFRQTADLSTWEEPKDPKKSTSSVDRCEQLLKQAFERFQEIQPTRKSNPISTLQTLLRQLDRNHSGQIDIEEFKKMCQALNFSATEATLEGLFHRYDLDHSGLMTVEEFARMLLKPDGDTAAKAKTSIARMREVLSYRAGGFPHLQAMARQFRIVDRDHSGELNKEEFFWALDTLFSYYGVQFMPAEKNSLFQFFDREGSQSVTYDEFVRAVRGDMNEFRMDWVKAAFDILDTDKDGVVGVDELMSRYSVDKNPQVRSGKVTADAAFKVFMDHYDINQDGKITFDEFLESYQWISASIDSDDYFELMMRNAWHISGGEGWAANTSNVRVLVEHTDGQCEVVEIKNDLGLDVHDNKAVVAALRKQGVQNINKVDLYS